MFSAPICRIIKYVSRYALCMNRLREQNFFRNFVSTGNSVTHPFRCRIRRKMWRKTEKSI